MPESNGEATEGRGTVGGPRPGNQQNRAYVPEHPTRSRTTMPSRSKAFSLVTATPDVNFSDYEPLQTPQNRTRLPVTSNNGDERPLQRGSESGLSSLAEIENSYNGPDASVASEEQPLPMLATLVLSTTSSVSKSTGNTGVGVESGPGRSGTAITGAATTTTSISPGTSFAGRSMTLLERRNKRERSALSLSCLSGLNVETLQESMRDTSVVLNSEKSPVPVLKGWSKTVASAALLSDYAMPSVHASSSRAPHSTAAASARPTTSQFHAQAPRRPISSDDGSSNPTSTSDSRTVDAIPGALKVIGYNILASRLASTDLYPTCPPSVLSEEYRLGLIKEELRCVDPDILLLEEISVAVHERTLGPYLRSALGMEGHHVVITDPDGTPRCTPLTQPSKAAAVLSPGPPTLFGIPCSSERKSSSTSITATLTGATTCSGDASARRGMASGATSSSTDVDRGNGPHHLPPLTEPCSSRRSSRCDSSVGVSRFSASSCGTPGIWPKRGEAAQLQHLEQVSLPPQEMSRSSLEERQANSKAVSNEDSMQHSYGSIGFTQGTAERAKRQTSSQLVGPTVPVLTMGSGAPPATLCAEKAAEGALEHRRVEMDGVSIFFKAARFRVLEVIPVLFNRLAAAEKRLTHYERNKLQVNSHNVALVVVLQDMQVIGVSRVYVVAAVHLIWQRINAQLWQAHQLLRVVEELKHKYSKAYVDLVYPSGRGSMVYDSAITQPPSVIDTPLLREGTRRHMQDDVVPQPPLVTPLPLQLPRTPPARRQSMVPSRTTTEASDLAGDSGCSSFFKAIAADRMPGRYASVCSAATSFPATAVTCIIGGDFNSERSGSVMEYLRTGRVPGGTEVMEYWRAPQLESPVPVDHTDRRVTGEATGSDAVNAPHPTSQLPPRVPPPTLSGVLSAARQELISPYPRHSKDSPLSSMGSPPSMLVRRATQSPPPSAEGTTVSAAATGGRSGEGLCHLQPCTPLSKRPSNPYPIRVSDGALSTFNEAADPLLRRQDSATDLTAAASTSLRKSGGAQSRQPAKEALDFNRGCPSPTPSSFTNDFVDTPSCDDGGDRSPPTVAATPLKYVLCSVPPRVARCGSLDAQSPLPRPSRLTKTSATVGTVSPASALQSLSSALQEGDCAACPVNHCSCARRRISPDINTESSTLDHSGSHSVSENGSVLSTALATSCTMRLAEHTRHDTLSLEFGEPDWEDEESRGRTPMSDQATDGTSSVQPSPSQGHMAGWGDASGVVEKAEGNEKRRYRIHKMASLADANGISRGRDSSMGMNLGPRLNEPPFSSYSDMRTPACPRSRPKRQPAGATPGARTPHPISPQVVRHFPLQESPQPLSETEYDTTFFNVSTSSPPTSLMYLPFLISDSANTPTSLPVSLIDDVMHAIRLSDAYAPYCYRHPSSVSAVNPSTNGEGRVLDHILYEDEHVVCGGVLRLGELQEIPNARVPSDHYMIGSVLIPTQELH
ncbi:endonuclease/exonuclease/phosphatase-like protein [Leishmania guyanensis]